MVSSIKLKNQPVLFYTIVWWFLSTGVFLFTYVELTNQVVLKIIIPVLFLMVLIYEMKIKIQKGLKLYIGLFLWGCLSLIYSLNTEMTLRYLQMLIGNVLIWYIASVCISKIKNIKALSYPVLLAFLVQAYSTLTDKVQEATYAVNQGLERATGLSSNENDQARLLLFGIVTVVILILYSKNKIIKAIYAFCIAGFMIGMLKTGSRESFIALAAMIIAFLFLTVRKKKYGYLIAATVIVTLLYNLGYNFVLNNTVLGRRMQIALEQGEQNVRFTLIKEGWNFFISQPLFGVGLGSFTTLSSTHQYSHNDYIEILASMGLPAFIIYISIYYDFFNKAKKIFMTYNGYYKNAIIVAISFLVGYLVLGVFDPTFYYPTTTLMLATYYTLIIKIYNQSHFAKAKLPFLIKNKRIKLNKYSIGKNLY